MSLIDAYIERVFGVKVSTRNDGLVATVGTEPVQVFRKNPNRIMWMVINLSVNTVYLEWSGNVSDENGVLLDPSGGIASSWIGEDASLTGDEVWIVADAANSNLKAFEVDAVA